MSAKKIVLAIASLAMLAIGVNAQSPDNGPKDKIEGTWRTAQKFADGSSDSALFTFGAGRNDQDGITVHSDAGFFVAAPSCLTAQGVWERTEDRTFTATDEAFCFDSTNNFAPAGKVRFRYTVTLSNDGESFSGPIHIDAFDTSGKNVFSLGGTLNGKRMLPVPPPSSTGSGSGSPHPSSLSKP